MTARVCLLFLLALFACDGNTVGLVSIAPQPRIAAPIIQAPGLLADLIEMKPIAAPTCTSGRACFYDNIADNLLYTSDANGLVLKLHAAQSYRTSASCAGLSSPANGDVCYDTGIPAFRFYNGGWTTPPADDTLLLHKAGSETITGTKTFGAGALASGATAFDLSGSTGTFLTTTGAVTVGGATTFAANKGIAYTAGTGAADFSNGSGIFKTTAGAVTVGPGAVGVSGNITLTSGVTLAAGSNTLISSDQLAASKLLIGSQATGDLLYASSATAWARAAAGTSTQVLHGAAGAPTWSAVALATDVSGTLPAGNGGTGATSLSTFFSVAGSVLGVASAQVPIRWGGGATTALGAATAYLTAPGQMGSVTEIYLSIGTRTDYARALYCYAGTAPGGADTVAFTLRLNAADQALTCTITGAATACSDTTGGHAVSIAAGNRLAIKAASSGVLAAGLSCAVEESN